MESIKSFKNQKIQNMQNITGGGKRVELTYDERQPDVVGDKYFYKNGCENAYKVVLHPGFANWLNGSRTVWTYAACGTQSDWN